MSKYNQTVTYWAPSTLNIYGEQSFGTPSTISARWEEKTEIFIDKATGKEKRSEAIVYLKNDLLENGFLFLGTSVQADPKNETDTYLIRRVDKSPSLKGNRYTRKIWL